MKNQVLLLIMTTLLLSSCKKEELEVQSSETQSHQHRAIIDPDDDKIKDFIDSEAFADFCTNAGFTPNLDLINKTNEEGGVNVYYIPSIGHVDSNAHYLMVISKATSNIYLPIYNTFRRNGSEYTIASSPIHMNYEYFYYNGEEDVDDVPPPCNSASNNWETCFKCAWNELFSDWTSIIACSVYPVHCAIGAAIACALIKNNTTGASEALLSELAVTYKYVLYDDKQDIIIVN